MFAGSLTPHTGQYFLAEDRHVVQTGRGGATRKSPKDVVSRSTLPNCAEIRQAQGVGLGYKKIADKQMAFKTND